LTELIIVGVSIAGLELLLRIVDYLLSRKTHSVGNSKKKPNHHKTTQTHRKAVEKTGK